MCFHFVHSPLIKHLLSTSVRPHRLGKSWRIRFSHIVAQTSISLGIESIRDSSGVAIWYGILMISWHETRLLQGPWVNVSLKLLLLIEKFPLCNFSACLIRCRMSNIIWCSPFVLFNFSPKSIQPLPFVGLFTPCHRPQQPWALGPPQRL